MCRIDPQWECVIVYFFLAAILLGCVHAVWAHPTMGIRIGEASHPGPIIQMPGDGHCLYHALAWWAGTNHLHMRTELAAITATMWNEICPWDTGSALPRYRRDTSDPTQWGTALQIAACAAIRRVTIRVETPFGTLTFGDGPTHWGLQLLTHPVGHYNVVAPELGSPRPSMGHSSLSSPSHGSLPPTEHTPPPRGHPLRAP